MRIHRALIAGVALGLSLLGSDEGRAQTGSLDVYYYTGGAGDTPPDNLAKPPGGTWTRDTNGDVRVSAADENPFLFVGLLNRRDRYYNSKNVTLLIQGDHAKIQYNGCRGHWTGQNPRSGSGFGRKVARTGPVNGIVTLTLTFPDCPEWEWVRFTKPKGGLELLLTVGPDTECARVSKSVSVPEKVEGECSFGCAPESMNRDLRITEVTMFPESVPVNAAIPPLFTAPPESGVWTGAFVFVDPNGVPRPGGGVQWSTDGPGLTAEQWFQFEFEMLGVADVSYTQFAFDAGVGRHLSYGISAAPMIREWRSVKTHAGVGVFGMTLNHLADGDGTTGSGEAVPERHAVPTAETRRGGLERIEVEFTGPVAVDPSAIVVTDGQLEYRPDLVTLESADELLVILFDELTLPDDRVLLVDLEAAITSHLRGDTDCRMSGLLGDVNGDGTVTTWDATSIEASLGQAVDATNFWHDLDLDGLVTAADVTLAEGEGGGSVRCGPLLAAVPWYEDFDDYDPGTGLDGGFGWRSWDDDPAFDAPVTDARSRGDGNAVEIGGDADLVRSFCGADAGLWRVSAWQYVPGAFTSGGGGSQAGTYFLLLNTYAAGGPYHWSVQMQLDSNDGLLKVRHGEGTSTIDVPYVTDRWVRIQTIVDLDEDWTQVYYDDTLVAEYAWTGGVLGDGGGALDLAVVDLYANGSSAVYYDDLVFERCERPAATFDDLITGSTLYGVDGWRGWDDDPAFDTPITDTQARSAPNAVAVAGDADIVRDHCIAGVGRWSYSAWQYVPGAFTSGGGGSQAGTYFLLLNTYAAGGPYHWSVQMQFDSNDGLLKVRHGEGTSTIDVPYVTDRWVRIQTIVDLDEDWTQVYYDDTLVAEYAWTGGVLGEGGGALDLAVVDLYANGSSTVYYDDLVLERVRCPGDVDASGDVNFADLLALLAAWGECDGCPEDVDGDGVVAFGDVLVVLAAWGRCP